MPHAPRRHGCGRLLDIPPGGIPITPVMLGDARLAQTFAERLLGEGIYVIGFFYPVVAQGQGAAVRVQISAAHEPAQIDQAISAFSKVGRALGVIFRASLVGRRQAAVAPSLLTACCLLAPSWRCASHQAQ